MSDFDTIIERHGTSSLKWDKYPQDVLPLWVADMDFPSPPAVVEALKRRADHGVFGYPVPPASLIEAIVNRLSSKFHWQVDPEWLVFLPGLVPALNLTCRTFAEDREGILSPIPIYPPFLSAPVYQNRKLVTVQTELIHGRWCLSPDAIRQAATPETRVFLFCNPHNPVGRSYGRDEVLAIAEACLDQNMLICSDEIHCDLLMDDVRHTPTASLSPEIAERTITLMAPSKTYNLPGLSCAYAIITNDELRRRFERAMRGLLDGANIMGYAACQAAYRFGSEWEVQLLDYLRGNRDFVEQFVRDEMPELHMAHVEATYLAWLDTRETDLGEPAKFFLDAGVGLGDGNYFRGKGFLRLNFGCPRSVLHEALERMKMALG